MSAAASALAAAAVSVAAEQEQNDDSDDDPAAVVAAPAVLITHIVPSYEISASFGFIPLYDGGGKRCGQSREMR